MLLAMKPRRPSQVLYPQVESSSCNQYLNALSNIMIYSQLGSHVIAFIKCAICTGTAWDNGRAGAPGIQAGSETALLRQVAGRLLLPGACSVRPQAS